MSAGLRNAIGVALFEAMRKRLPASHATTDNLIAFLDAVFKEMPPNQAPPSETKIEQRLRRAEEEAEAWRQRVTAFVNRRAVYGDDHKRTIEAMDALDDALEGFDPARYAAAKDVPSPSSVRDPLNDPAWLAAHALGREPEPLARKMEQQMRRQGEGIEAAFPIDDAPTPAIRIDGTWRVYFNRPNPDGLPWCVAPDAGGWEIAVANVAINAPSSTVYEPKATPDDDDGRPSAWIAVTGVLTVSADGRARIGAA